MNIFRSIFILLILFDFLNAKQGSKITAVLHTRGWATEGWAGLSKVPLKLCQSLCGAVAVLLWAAVSAAWLPASGPPVPSEALVSGNAVNALLLGGPIGLEGKKLWLGPHIPRLPPWWRAGGRIHQARAGKLLTANHPFQPNKEWN